jgi:hypothetical protein
VLNLLEYAAKLRGIPFEEDQVQGRISEVHEAESEEDMLIYGCQIARGLLIGKVDIGEAKLARQEVVKQVISLIS